MAPPPYPGPISPPNFHVKRIYVSDGSGGLNTSGWVDVIRMDNWYTTARAKTDEPYYQGIVWVLQWLDSLDDPNTVGDVQNEGNNQTRNYDIVVIGNPTSGPYLPGDAGSVQLNLIDNTKTEMRGRLLGTTSVEGRYYKNAPLTGDNTQKQSFSRIVTAVRAVHNDLGGFNFDSSQVIDWPTYKAALDAGSTDSTQFLDQEVSSIFFVDQRPQIDYQSNAADDGTNQFERGTGQFLGSTMHGLGNNNNFDVTAAYFLPIPGSAPIPPIRLDPYEAVINVKWRQGPATFVAVDQGSNAFSNANTGPSFDPTIWPNPALNYPGGYNLWQSSDGKTWTHTSQGIVDDNPAAYQATSYDVPAGYSWIGAITIYLPPTTAPVYQTTYDGVFSEGSGTSPLPPGVDPGLLPGGADGQGWLVGSPTVIEPPLIYPLWTQSGPVPDLFTIGVPDQPLALLTDYGLWNGSPATTTTTFGQWGQVNRYGTMYTAWDITSGTISALDGIMEFVTSSSDPIQVFVIGFNGYSGGSPQYGVPLYYRSVSGSAWELFTPPIAPSTPWFPSPSDCFFDDGTQRTTTDDGHGNLTFDGEPTYLWYSFASYSGPLYESNDGTKTWTLSSRLPGNNPSTSKTDDNYVGDPDNEPFYGEMGTTRSGASEPTGPGNEKWNSVFGIVTATGHKMGVQIVANPIGGGSTVVIAGPADQDPSTWSVVTLPTPPNVATVVDYMSNKDLVEYNIGIANYTVQQTIVENQLVAFQAASTWADAHGHPDAAFYDYAVTTNEYLLHQIMAKIASIESAHPSPGPRTYALNPLYVAYGVPPGSHDGIWVMCGTFTTIPDPVLGEASTNSNMPLFWWSTDAVTWHVASYDYDFAGDGSATNCTALEYLVSGNPAPQLYANLPS